MADPKVSILLPTVRPGHLRASYDSIRLAAGTLPYEIIVVADFDPIVVDDHCLWLRRPRYGPIDAIEHARSHAVGDYLFVFNDESVLDQRALQILYNEAQNEPWALYSPRHLPDFNFVYYGKPFAAFPFVHYDVVTKLGGLFDPRYRGFYADPDLSLRAHKMGMPIRIVQDAILRHANNMHAPGHQENLTAYYAADQRLFRSRWDHLGEFRDPS